MSDVDSMRLKKLSNLIGEDAAAEMLGITPTFALPEKMEHKNRVAVTATWFLASKRV